MEMDMLNEGEAKEIEILEFKAGGNSYGISVNEIREILAYNMKPTPVPNAHAFIEGIIMPRDFIITILDFNKCFNLNSDDEFKNEMIINTRFGDLNIALHVDSVNGIHKQNEAAIHYYDSEEEHSEFTTGFILNGDKKLELVDYIKLFQSINSDIDLA